MHLLFFSQQCAEKALKAMVLEKLRENPSTHNLIELSRMLNAPKELLSDLADLNSDYAVARYPDAANGVPQKFILKA